jgi:hypothetical protein
MLITKIVLLKIMGNNKLQHYRDLGYDTSKNFEVLVDHLLPSSRSIITACCNICNTIRDVEYISWKKNYDKHSLYACSKKCAVVKTKMTNLLKYGFEYATQSDLIKEKSKITNLEKYGVEFASQSEKIKEIIKQTNLEKYGMEYPTQSQEVKEKSKRTNLEKYGVEFASQSVDFRERVKATLLKNYGVDNPSKSKPIQEKKKETSIRNWGVDNPSKSPIVSEKRRQTNLENLGVEYPMQSSDVRIKSKESNLLKYGTEFASQSDIFKENMNINNLKKWGVKWTLQSKDIRYQINKTNLLKYGGHPLKNESYRKDNMLLASELNYIKYEGNNISSFRCDKGHEYLISSSNWYSRKYLNVDPCTFCYPIGDSNSLKQDYLLLFISGIYKGEIIENYRDTYEIDIYLPDLKIGFEFNGIYWHSEKFKDKHYHLNKKKWFESRGIELIYIMEDDFTHRRDIIESQISNRLKVIPNKISARKCVIKEIVNNELSKEFLNKNHLQGWKPNPVKIGLFYNEELVSIMTFDNFEGRKKMTNNSWNLSRFCNIIGYNINGSASKLLKYFIKKYNPTRIISYADYNWSTGGVYYTLGFNLYSITKPDYQYVVGEKRVHKQNFKKIKKERENIRHLRIWDCGKIKFEIIL